MTKRFYVTMTWHDWPEGGSYGTVVEARDHAEAVSLCEQEMAASYGEAIDEKVDPHDYDWHLVDCFDLDEFIEDKRRKPDNIWAENENHPVDQWKYEVENDDTRLGYWDWQNNQRDP
jgi:hypothetical protein